MTRNVGETNYRVFNVVPVSGPSFAAGANSKEEALQMVEVHLNTNLEVYAIRDITGTDTEMFTATKYLRDVSEVRRMPNTSGIC